MVVVVLLLFFIKLCLLGHWFGEGVFAKTSLG